MIILDAPQTRAALPWSRLIDALDAGFRTAVEAPLRHAHRLGTEGDDILLLMPAWQCMDGQAKGWGGVKIVNVHPGNAARGLPAVASSYMLFSRETGQHRMILDGGELTARRTAAASALAARRLARPDSRRHLIVGAGHVAQNLADAFRAALPIETVEVWNRSPDKAQTLARGLVARGIPAAASLDLRAAVERADVISCATLSAEPLVQGGWLQPGQHLDLIGSFTPQMRETDDEGIRRSRVFLDTDHAAVESGDITGPLERGVIVRADIQGTLLGLCRDDLYPRRSAEEITLFKAVGSAIEDLATAVLAWNTVAAGASQPA